MDALPQCEPAIAPVTAPPAAPAREGVRPAERPAAERSGPGHIPALDGVRGFAILLVFLTHAYHASWHAAGSGGPVSGWQRLFDVVAWGGWVGVDLFFVLSGFLITGILLDTRDDPRYFRNFYARRALRIFPLYYAVVAVRLFLLPQLGVPRLAAVGAGEAASYWLYASNFWQSFAAPAGQPFNLMLSVTWSLAVEEQFYLLWPLVVWCCPPRRLPGLCLLMLAAAPACRVGLWLGGSWCWAAYSLTPCRMDALAAGALVAWLARRDGLPAWRRAAAGCAALGIAGLAGVVWWQRNASNLEWPMALAGYSFSAVLFAGLLVLMLSRPAGVLAWFCRARLPRTFGKYSYALYLFHAPIVLGLLPLAAHWPPAAALVRQLVAVGGMPACTIVITVLGALLTLVPAWLSWHLFERHWLSLKRYFVPGQPTTRVVRVPSDRAA